ncbi:MFS general substrate transporter [Poronia punctata]|nr:MFS general substrate transporter [Poronia punctata]
MRIAQMSATKEVVDIEGPVDRNGSSLSSPESPTSPGLGPHVDEAKLMRKIDLHVLPILFTVYVAAFIDRINISSALTLGLTQELGLTDQQPNIALTIFFVPYILFEIPSNILMKRVHPHIWLSGCILIFGIIMIGQGFVESYGGLLATRFFLGLAEAGIFPGSFYLISFWYRRDEAQKRFTFYWSSTIIAGAFGGLLASAIANLEGARGLASWRWVFIIEGVVTVLIGVIAFFSITDFPKEAKWLLPHEKTFLLAKTGADESHKVAVTMKDVFTFLSKPIHWIAALMYLSLLIPSYSFVFFVPTIVQALHYGSVQTQLHAVPPFAAAFGFALLTAYLSDKLRIRSAFIFLGLALLITGLSLLTTIHGASSFSAEYAGLCLTAMGTFGTGGIVVCWYVMNLRGHVERSIGSAWLICVGNIGGIIATFTFLKKDAPYYRTGYLINLSMSALCVVTSASYGLIIWSKRRAEGRDDNSQETKQDLLYL